MYKLNRKGYTLLELILVIIIFSFILTVFKVNMSSISQVNKTMEINRLVNDLKSYRDKALINKINIEFRIDSDKKSYRFTELSKNRIELSKGELNSGYRIYHNNFGSYIVFRSTGAPSRGVTLTLRDKDEVVKIIIQPVTGNIRIEKKVD